MKKIFSPLLIVAAVIMFASCTPKIDDYFSESSAERVQEVITNTRTVLSSASNGWLMQYYPSANTYGGYNILCKFTEDGNVTVASEIFSPDTTVTSTYDIVQSAGVVLSFNSYNKIMNYFSDPTNPDGIGDNGKGMEGDFEFRLFKITADSIIMKGKKTNSRIVMTPLPAGTSWSAYLKSIQDAETEMTFANYYYVANNDTAKITSSYHTFTLSYTLNDSTIENTIPYIVTPEGLSLYDTLSYNGAQVTSLKYNGSQACSFTGNDAHGASATLYGVTLPLNSSFTSGVTWYFTYDNMGTYGKKCWDTPIAKLLAQDVKEKLYYFVMSKTNGTAATGFDGKFRNAFTTDQSGGVGALYYNYKKIGEDQIKLEFGDYGNGYKTSTVGDAPYKVGKAYYENTTLSFSDFFKPFMGKTFVLTANSKNNPTVMTMTDTSDPSNVVICTRASTQATK
jgi:hypothetical protein